MKPLLLATGLLVAGALVLPSATASAAQAKATPATTHAEKAPAKAVASEKAEESGTIEKWDATSRTLVLKHRGQEMSFVLAQNATIKMDKAAGTVADLVAGHTARVEYVMMNGQKHVEHVDVHKAQAATRSGKGRK